MYYKRILFIAVVILAIFAMGVPSALADPPPGGTLEPTSIPQFVIPLVIPPVMNNSGIADDYDIAVRQFKQQILPGGIWDTVADPTNAHANFPATTVWSYGPDADPVPDSTALGGAAGVAPAPNSQFNYPAYTIETKSNIPVSVRWINDLVDPATGNYLSHILPIDRTLHWANPEQDCRMGFARTDCTGNNPVPYTGPVPIVTHVHGAHVDGHSDGYPEAWWLPAAVNIPVGYATSGSLFDDATGTNPGNLGYADYLYRQDQPAATLWYHDHSLGMTRNNVYAGPAGFWIIRGGPFDTVDDQSTGRPMDGKLPGPPPKPGQSVLELNLPPHNIRQSIRAFPIAIQDRSFNSDGSLFYPDNRAFFEGLNPDPTNDQFLGEGQLLIDFVPNSDVAPIWNPEAFFNVMVVNGVSWPMLEVAQAKYRFRFLNGCNSRFLILKFSNPDVQVWQIGAEQGFLPAPVNLNAFTYPHRAEVEGTMVDVNNDGNAYILMALAERADTIVDFSGLASGAEVFLYNIGPDEPFGGGRACDPEEDPDDGFCDFVPADSDTTGRVMKFVVNSALNGKGMTDPFLPNGKPNPQAATDPANLDLNAEAALGGTTAPNRHVSLNELDSEVVCVTEVDDDIIQLFCDADDVENEVEGCNEAGDPLPPESEACAERGGEPFGPLEALLGTVNCYDGDDALVDCDDPNVVSIEGIPLKWMDDSGIDKEVLDALGNPLAIVNVTENPALNAIEEWKVYNFTMDAHPIHLHLVRFEVKGRETFDGGLSAAGQNNPLPWETGFKDTFISYPGEISTVKAKFDIEGLYVWHCHIVEHEDNEMMRPYAVGLATVPAP